MIVGVAIGLGYSWQISLICLAVSPLMIIGGIIMSKLQWKAKSFEGGNDGKIDYYNESNALLSDMILNYRTIISFG